MAGTMNRDPEQRERAEWLASAIKTGADRVSAEQIKLGGNLARERLSRYVRRAVSKSGLSQNEIADILGVNKSTISRLLGSSRNMTIESAGRIFRALGEFVVISSEPVPSPAQKGNIEPHTRGQAFSYVCNQPGNRWEVTFRRHDDAWQDNATALAPSDTQALGPVINVSPLKVNLVKADAK